MAVTVCDARDCPARATREIWFDSGHSLWSCSHHASTWFPWITPQMRFTPDDLLILA